MSTSTVIKGSHEPALPEPQVKGGASTASASSLRVTAADIQPLFEAYYEILLMDEPPHSFCLPRWVPGRGWIERGCNALRPRHGYRSTLVRHIRRQVLAVDRAYCLRLAAEHKDKDDADEYKLIQYMKDALPPSPPRWMTFAAVVTIVVLTQLFLNVLDSIPLGGLPLGGGDLSTVVTTATSPSAKSVGDLLNALYHSYASQLFAFYLAFGLAIYLTLRLYVSGLRQARMVLNGPRALTRRHRNSHLKAKASAVDVESREAELFRHLKTGRPHFLLPLDLLVKAALLAGPLFLGVYALRYYSAGSDQNTDLIVALVILVPAGGRALWLLGASLRRNQRWTGPVILGLGIVLVVLPALLAADKSPADAAKAKLENGASAYDHATLKKLFGETSVDSIDLPGIDLHGVDLHGVSIGGDLSDSDMSGSDLAEADLSLDTLVGASLQGANLAGANLWEATLFRASLQGANLAGADLESADLKGADLEGAHLTGAKMDGACYDRFTNWPAGYHPPRGAVRGKPQKTSTGDCDS